ncbi:MAG TPA: hypothetical protein GXZ59_07995 [Clostridiaceae bacterium]|nr:hypothetical protein [Clostridiaceae bacterium]
MKTWQIILLTVLVTLLIVGAVLYLNKDKFLSDASGSKPLSRYIPDISVIEAGTLLIDYYETTTAIVTEPGSSAANDSFEITLSAHSDTEILLDIYTRAHEEAEEEHRSYFVPLTSLSGAYKIIDQYDMKNWHKAKDTGGTGRYHVCKYFQNGELIRVSSDQMPADGTEAFAELKSFLLALISDKSN